jgi:hypothetical protein
MELEFFPLNVAIKRLSHLLHIREVPGSNLEA